MSEQGTTKDLSSDQFGPLFEFKTRRETEKAIAAMLPICDCEGPQKIGPGYHAPYCSTVPGGNELRAQLESQGSQT